MSIRHLSNKELSEYCQSHQKEIRMKERESCSNRIFREFFFSVGCCDLEISRMLDLVFPGLVGDFFAVFKDMHCEPLHLNLKMDC